MRRLLLLLALTAGGVLLGASPAFAPCHVVSFVGDPYGVQEHAGKVTVTITNNGGQQTDSWTADYATIDDSAKAGRDYKRTTGTITLPHGTSEGSFSVPIINDSVHEATEDFRIKVSNANGCTGFQYEYPDNATVIIQDDDAVLPKLKPTPTPTPTPTKSSPKPTPKPTKSASPSPSPSTASPTPSPTTSAIAAAADDGGGLSGGALAGIVVGTLAVGGAGAFFVRRRFLT
jgi:cell division septation protein DedD